MAALSLGSSVLSAVLQVVFDRATTYAQQQLVGVTSDLKPSLKKLQDSLFIIRHRVSDAEKRVLCGGDAALESWLRQLKDVIYEADGMFDLLEYERLKKEAMKARTNATTCSLRYALMKRIPDVSSKHFFTAKITEIQGNLDSLLSTANSLRLLEKVVETSNPSELRMTTEYLQDDMEEFIGRDGEKTRIISLLLEESVTDNSFTVVSLFGIGGIGKTTLAQLVFNDLKDNNRFDLRLWVCVSDDFSEERIINDILNSDELKEKERKDDKLKPNTDFQDIDPRNPKKKLKDALKGKRFLLVLDDVWNEDNKKWSDLAKLFENEKGGSKILVTCRSKGVASKMSLLNHQIELGALPENDLWSLFRRHAFCGSSDVSKSLLDELETIAREIVKKLKGLPLAAKTIGRILNSDLSVLHWQSILRSEIWQLPQEEGDILPALRLSYEHLPQHLKPCFAFCSVFPKHFRYSKREIILMWISLGFVQPIPGTNILLEDIGNHYVDELLNRSMFQACKETEDRFVDETKDMFVIHDLLHDMAISVSKDEILTIHGDNPSYQIPNAVRHLVIRCDDGVKWDILKRIPSLSILRTLILLPNELSWWTQPVPDELKSFLGNKLPQAKNLRILYLSGFAMTKFPVQLSKTKCLRYLNISESRLKSLPSSLTDLYHLQVLTSKYDYKPQKLPSDASNLMNLRHLNIKSGRGVHIGNIQGLNMLQELTFSISPKTGHEIEILKHMKQLCDLDIRSLENVKSKEQAAHATLLDKEHLKKLRLKWSRRGHPSAMFGNHAEVLEGLEPNGSITSLTIEGYCGERCPIWLENLSLTNLEHISLQGCDNLEILPPLGQLPRVKTLSLWGMGKLREVAPDFFGQRSSPTLECCCQLSSFKISHCPKLENFLPWIPTTISILSVKYCPGASSPISTESWFPSALKSLELTESGVVGNALLAAHFANSERLEELTMDGCNTIESLPINALKRLRSLSIKRCEKLNIINMMITFDGQLLPASLASFSVRCESLPPPCSSSEDILQSLRGKPPMQLPLLQYVRIEGNDPVLLKAWFQLLRSNKSMEHMSIQDFRNMESFDEEMEEILVSFESLRRLELLRLPQLRTLPNRLRELSALVYLNVYICPELKKRFSEERHKVPHHVMVLVDGRVHKASRCRLVNSLLRDCGVRR